VIAKAGANIAMDDSIASNKTSQEQNALLGEGRDKRAQIDLKGSGAQQLHVADSMTPNFAHEEAVERQPAKGLWHIYLIDSDDERRAEVHKIFAGRSNLAIGVYRSRAAFMTDIEGLDEGCVILFDYGADEDSDVTNFIRALNTYQRFACLMLAAEQNIRTAIEAMKAGAIDCMLYPCPAEEILSGVDSALAKVRQEVAENAAIAEAKEQINRLTDRERDVLYGLMRGKSNKMIAIDLDISPRTVEIYRAHMMEKLGAHSLSDTLKIAFAAGLG